MDSREAYSQAQASKVTSYSSEDLYSRSVSKMMSVLLWVCLLSSSLILPLYLKNLQLTYAVSWISCVTSAAVIFCSAKKRFNATLAVFFMALAVGAFSSPIIPAMLFGAITAVGAGSTLICSLKGKRIFFIALLPILAYGVSFLITLDPITSLFSLVPMLPAAAMGFASKRDTTATVSITLSAIAEVILVAAGISVWVYSVYGGLSPAILDEASEYFKGGVVYYSELGLKAMSATEITPALQKELYASANDLVNISFGLIGATCVITSYFSHKISLGLSAVCGTPLNPTSKNIRITVSAHAAWIFIVAYILSFTTDSSNMISFTANVGLNICIMLLPCLVYVGFSAISALPKRLGLLGLILWGGVIMLIFMSSSSFLFVFALIGAIYIAIRNLDAWAKDHYSKGDKK